jgi:hypothetical protein
MLGEGKPNVKQLVDRRAAASDANDFGPAQGAIAGPDELRKLVGSVGPHGDEASTNSVDPVQNRNVAPE